MSDRAVAVGNSAAVELTAAGSTSVTQHLALRNLGPATLWVGGSSAVTPGTGLPVYIGETYAEDFATTTGQLWGITASGAADVRVRSNL